MAVKQSTNQDHILLLKHVKLDEKSAEEILKKYNVSKRQLPIILKKDPALKSLEVDNGDIIEVERPSATVNKAKFYRVVRG
ncbi:DNA-directed RNA polymerase subunit H [Candidatus Woesearchaeota archaeon]|nr:DNA-directed RNA polymerase subunit H [Candidatus Woesearchaeota archaeon]